MAGDPHARGGGANSCGCLARTLVTFGGRLVVDPFARFLKLLALDRLRRRDHQGQFDYLAVEKQRVRVPDPDPASDHRHAASARRTDLIALYLGPRIDEHGILRGVPAIIAISVALGRAAQILHPGRLSSACHGCTRFAGLWLYRHGGFAGPPMPTATSAPETNPTESVVLGSVFLFEASASRFRRRVQLHMWTPERPVYEAPPPHAPRLFAAAPKDPASPCSCAPTIVDFPA